MGICLFCEKFDESTRDSEKMCICTLLGFKVKPISTCPGYKDKRTEEQIQHDAEERERLLKLSPTVTPVKKVVAHSQVVRKKRAKVSEPEYIQYAQTYKEDMKPFAHQQQAIDFYKDKDEIALFFEMGCGKSFTTLQIAQEKFKAGQIKGLLVVAPNDVHRQWFDELVNGQFNELQVDFEAQCVGGRGGQKDLYDFVFDDTFKFVSVNVDTFSQPHKWEAIVEWANSGPYMIAIDEATVIKNPSSKRSQRLLYEFNNIKKRGKTIIESVKKCPVRAVLTGTPVTNGPMDLWSIMEFIRPNFFNRNYYSFRAYYGMFTKLTVDTGYGSRDIDVLLTEKTWKGIHDAKDFTEAAIVFGCSEDTYMTIKHQDHFIGPYKHADELKQKLDEVAIFRKLTDCVDMPAVQYVERKVGMSPAQQAAYNSMKKELLAEFDGYQTTAVNKLVVSLRLQQIASGFIMGHKVADLDDWDLGAFSDISDEDVANLDLMPDQVVWLGESVPKLDALMDDVAECDKPLLILTRYSAEAAKIYELCDKAGYKTGLFTGWKVIGGVDAFKDGELDILVANSAKISRGFNLQCAHVTLFYSNTFSMEIRQQAEFRTFRMGQEHPCLYVDYSAADVDDTINTALRLKKGLLDYIRDKNIKEAV